MEIQSWDIKWPHSNPEHDHDRKPRVAVALMLLCFISIYTIDICSPKRGTTLRGSKDTLSHIPASNGMYSNEVHSSRRLNEVPGIVTSGILGGLIFIGLTCCILRKTLQQNIDKVAADYNEEHEAELKREIEIQKTWTEQQFAPGLAARGETPGIWRSLKDAAQKHRLRKDEAMRKKKLRQKVCSEQQDSENSALDQKTDWAYGVGLKSKSNLPASDAKAAVCAETGVWGSFKRGTRKFSARFQKGRSKAGQERSKEQPSPDHGDRPAQTKTSTTDLSQPRNQSKSSSKATPEGTTSGAGKTDANVGMWGSFKQVSRSGVRKLTGRLADQAAKVRPKRKRAPRSSSSVPAGELEADSAQKAARKSQASDPGPREAASASREDAAPEPFKKTQSEPSQLKREPSQGVWLPERQTSKGKQGRATEGRRYSHNSLTSQSTHVSSDSNLP
eukprot:gnl/MRDRNA2_/MRDRNA2_31542_c0_seq1.p1 gnl/MRDRNA2_/MRDRNA2_31542_c0~~gnl/MRDRNA2_/MRDRNA2_31542_c0_seq1.p1  ORF type:complete len:446 (-),score=88.68 gnl/MRDRNA2_/MRDRNA2_31542_c0_seq1:47-1384(-)